MESAIVLLAGAMAHMHGRLRQHERGTNADRVLEERLRRLLRAEPVITHRIAPA